MSEEMIIEKLQEELKASQLRETTLEHLYKTVVSQLEEANTQTNIVKFKQERALTDILKIEESHESRVDILKDSHSRQVSTLKQNIKELSQENYDLRLKLHQTETIYEEKLNKLQAHISHMKKSKRCESYADIQKLCLVKNSALAKAEYFKAEYHKQKQSLSLSQFENFDMSFSNIEDSVIHTNEVQKDQRLATKGIYFGSENACDQTYSTVYCNEVHDKVASLEKYVKELLEKIFRIDEERCVAVHNERKASIELRKRQFEVEMQEQQIEELENQLKILRQAIELGEGNLQNIITGKIYME